MNVPTLRPRHWLALFLGFGALVALLFLCFRGEGAPRFRHPAEPLLKISTGTVKEGDVLASLLIDHGVPNKCVAPIEKSMKKLYDPRYIQAGHTYEIASSTFGTFQYFAYRIDPTEAYLVTRSSEDVYQCEKNVQKTVWMERRLAITINEFLERDMQKQGYDSNLIGNLATDIADDIFAWRIDFFTEQRVGDKLDILFEQEYMLGSETPLKGGRHLRVLAASYVGSATKVKENIAIRFQEPDAKRPDYYDPDGNAVRRAFLRAPFTRGAFRVSSGFNNHRFHPILRVYRPHHGTDYAASIGTPVACIGRGTVVRAEWYAGYGNCVDVRHNAKFTSRYGHLSKIAVRRGQTVEQGQYIGRVGNTGLSTGPHLHFEMLVDGVQRNFLTMSFPAASAVLKANMPEFLRVKDELMARLNAHEPEKPPQMTMNPTTK